MKEEQPENMQLEIAMDVLNAFVSHTETNILPASIAEIRKDLTFNAKDAEITQAILWLKNNDLISGESGSYKATDRGIAVSAAFYSDGTEAILLRGLSDIKPGGYVGVIL